MGRLTPTNVRTWPAWRPAAPARPARLGQMAAAAIRVGVVDINGRPISGADVVVRAAGTEARGTTDKRGLFVAQFAGGLPADTPIEASASLNDYSAFEKGTVPEGRDGTIWVRFPLCLSAPILTTAEIIALAAAAALTGAGYYWKLDPLKVTGEVFFGTVVFTSIYRLSCL